MLQFKAFVNEARRNPKQNPKISAYEWLRPYKDRDDIFISFTSIGKIGINPHSGYNTPNGIYTYPLKEIWEEFDHNNERIKVPFVGQAPYLWILQENCTKFQRLGKYTQSDLNKDLDKMKALFKKKGSLGGIVIDKKGVNELIDTFGKDLIADQGLTLIKKPTIRSLMDDPDANEYIKFDKEQHKKWFKRSYGEGATKQYLNIDLEDKIDLQQKILDRIVLKLNPLAGLIAGAMRNSKGENPAKTFWNITRWIAHGYNPIDDAEFKVMTMGKGVKFKHNITAQNWNNLLRQLGYCGFADKQGQGIIHPAERTQAVFLSKSAFKVLDKVPNISPQKVITDVNEISMLSYRKLRYDKKTNTFVLKMGGMLEKPTSIPFKDILKMSDNAFRKIGNAFIEPNLERGYGTDETLMKQWFKVFPKISTKLIDSMLGGSNVTDEVYFNRAKQVLKLAKKVKAQNRVETTIHDLLREKAKTIDNPSFRWKKFM